MVVCVWCDGSSNNNGPYKGIGGWAYILTYKKKVIHKESGRAYPTTNNIMETCAAMYGVEKAIELGAKKIVVVTDSQYVIYGIERLFYTGLDTRHLHEFRTNREVWFSFIKLIKDSGIKISLRKVKGHSGIKYNEMADKLAGEAKNTLKEAYEIKNTSTDSL